MLKNWTVTTEPVKAGLKGVMTRELYLLSSSHRNHQNTEKIISLIGNAKTSQLIALRGEEYKTTQQILKTRGRPISSYAMEFCLTLPRGFRPSVNQWRLMTGDCCRALAHNLKLTHEETQTFKKLIRAVLHQQPQQGNLGSGDHVHLIVGKVLGTRVLKMLQKKSATRLIKSAFNTAVLKHCQIDHRLYVPHSPSKGVRLNEWRYQQKQARESLETQKVILKLQKQIDRWLNAKRARIVYQEQRQYNRISNTLQELSLCHLTAEQSSTIDRLKASAQLTK
ncbi:hypothetical protein A1QO_07930 [Vibrio genomosp. F10 str. ZF-129]|uniref:Uncharacterized protein n=1 Tax=Vibrio genomosp. F10 str. ZF-129 TaxID=1187848 RepID=A0A1E5BF65_9VIBR|nr:hypothetical protein [Vibrio genomosp. F10]OEE34438.1 hypothetical protein A1QO_07930 [Vibrio genomosp. F10 str. ZF-129]